MPQPIEVLGSGRRTRIIVRDWPDARATWYARTVDDRGRELQVLGWKNLASQIEVGRLKFRMGRRSLTIASHSLESPILITGEALEILARMVLCAQTIATRLQAKGIGDGCLDWQLDSNRIGEVNRLFDDFSPTKKHRSPLAGKRYLRWCP